MELSTIYMVMGFLFAAYAVIANDSLQTLGTFLASNKKIKWYILALLASLVMIGVLSYGWYVNDGDLSYGRLSDKGIPVPDEFTIWHALAPLSLLILTRFGFPVSTSFLVLSVFGTGVFIQKMLMKSLLGYAVAAIAAYVLWFVLSHLLNEIKDEKDKKVRRRWVVAQWFATGYLWSVWLMHDMANIAVFLPRQIDFTTLLLVLGALTAGLFYIFWRRGGPIQKVVVEKTGTRFIRSATIIDVVYATILFIFKEMSSIPMSTTWVFVGLLAGRELAIMRQFDSVSKTRKVFPMVAKDFAKVMFGLVVSLAIALGAAYLA